MSNTPKANSTNNAMLIAKTNLKCNVSISVNKLCTAKSSQLCVSYHNMLPRTFALLFKICCCIKHLKQCQIFLLWDKRWIPINFVSVMIFQRKFGVLLFSWKGAYTLLKCGHMHPRPNVVQLISSYCILNVTCTHTCTLNCLPVRDSTKCRLMPGINRAYVCKRQRCSYLDFFDKVVNRFTKVDHHQFEDAFSSDVDVHCLRKNRWY